MRGWTDQCVLVKHGRLIAWGPNLASVHKTPQPKSSTGLQARSNISADTNPLRITCRALEANIGWTFENGYQQAAPKLEETYISGDRSSLHISSRLSNGIDMGAHPPHWNVGNFTRVVKSARREDVSILVNQRRRHITWNLAGDEEHRMLFHSLN